MRFKSLLLITLIVAILCASCVEARNKHSKRRKTSHHSSSGSSTSGHHSDGGHHKGGSGSHKSSSKEQNHGAQNGNVDHRIAHKGTSGEQTHESAAKANDEASHTKNQIDSNTNAPSGTHHQRKDSFEEEGLSSAERRRLRRRRRTTTTKAPSTTTSNPCANYTSTPPFDGTISTGMIQPNDDLVLNYNQKQNQPVANVKCSDVNEVAAPRTTTTTSSPFPSLLVNSIRFPRL